MKKAKRQLSSTVVVFAILIVVILVGCGIYTKHLEKQNEGEIIRSFINYTKNGMDGVHKRMEQLYASLDNVAEVFIHEGGTSLDEKDELLQLMKDISKNASYLGLGIADIKGNMHTTYGVKLNVAGTENFKRSVAGEPWITSSKIVEGIADTEECVFLASVPIEKQGEVIGVAYAVCSNNFFEGELESSEYATSGRCVLIDSEGRILAKSKSVVNMKVGEVAIGHQASGTKSNVKVDESYTKLEEDGIGVAYYSANMSLVMCYGKLNRDGWYLLHTVDEDVLMEAKDKVMSIAYMLTGLFVCLYLITFGVVMRMQSNHHKKIEQIAYVDELTGGISYEKFRNDAIEIFKKEEDVDRAVVALDIDKFKFINDIFGYEEGNKVIRFIWDSIKEMSRPGEIFSHRRADQYVLLLKVESEDELLKRMEELSEKVAQHQIQKEKNYELVLSIGIYIVNKNEKNILLEHMIDRAEIAKQSVKGKHIQRCALYDDKLRQKILRDQEIENRMEKALENEEFKVFYQPKYNSHSCELTGAEALVRWHSETGMIFPNEFIPLFESNGFIVELDRYMFEKVCRDIRKWMDEGYQVVPVSVNLSQLQLYNTSFIEEYQDIMEKYEIPSDYVQLELTETTLFSETGKLNDIIDKLHGIGIRILMDDFGTGYSSLTMLKNVSVDVLKLDKSFVDDIGEPKVDIVVSTIVSLGQSLEMKIVAEGVETKEQYEFLRDIFCDEIQGYYFSRPIPEEDYRQLLIKEVLMEEKVE